MITSPALYPAAVAVLLGGMAFALGGVFFLALQYHRYGRLSLGRTVAAAALVVYVFAVGAYTMLPLPASKEASCAAGTGGVDLDPLGPMRDLGSALAGGLGAALHDPLLWQLVLNVALFIPFGILAVRLLGIHPLGAVLLGALASLSIEGVQYTGVFGLYCRYRVADVGDLETNTLGALIGVLLAITPLFGWIKTPGQLDAAATRRPLTRIRRLWGMLFDVAFVSAAGVVASATVETVRLVDRAQPLPDLVLSSLIAIAGVLPLCVTVLPVLGARRASLGQRCVWLDVTRTDGRRAPLLWALVRALLAGGGYTFLVLFSARQGSPDWIDTVLFVWVVVCGLGVLFDPSARGLAARSTALGFAPRSGLRSAIARP